MVLLVRAGVVYLLLCAALFVFQRRLIYFPQPLSKTGASSEMTLDTAAGAVRVTTREVEGPGAVVYFGGNAEDVCWSIGELEAAFPARALYLLHYRGYGGSAGGPSEDGLFADALQLFDKVRRRHSKIIVIGRSLGSGLAVRLASMRAVEGLVLVTPYSSLTDVAARTLWFVPVRLLLRDRYESWRYAPQVKAPVTIVVAEQDEVIPRESTERLRDAFPKERMRYVVVPGAGHNAISGDPSYAALIGREPGK